MNEEELIKQLKWYENRYGPYIPKAGLRNWKNLFRKPTLQEWTILFMLLMGLFMAWAYYHDIEACKINCERTCYGVDTNPYYEYETNYTTTKEETGENWVNVNITT